MPDIWKKATVSSVLSGLRSKRAAASPLVVETGFPTSLADLVVKHRARLRNPSRKKRPDHDPTTTPSSPPSPPPPVVAARTPAAAAAAVEPPCSPEVRCITPSAPLETGNRRWYGFFAAMLLVLVLLVIGWKRLVAGITISAFILLLLDFLEFRVLEYLNPCSDARRGLNSVAGGLGFAGRELVSPIREVGVEKVPHLSRPCGNREGSVVGMEAFSERRELSAVSTDMNAISLANDYLKKKKKKKLWKRFLPKKFRKRRVGNDREEIDSCSSSQIVSDGSKEEDLPIEQEEQQIDNAIPNNEIFAEISCRDESDVGREGNDTGETKLWSSGKIIFIVIVLLGLLRGRAMALVLTIGWYLATRSIEILCGKWKAYRTQPFL